MLSKDTKLVYFIYMENQLKTVGYKLSKNKFIEYIKVQSAYVV